MSSVEQTGPRQDERVPGRRVARITVDTQLWVAEALASWVVRRAFEVGYRQATGRDLPSARDRSTPMRRVLMWTAVTAASVAVADAVVDRFVLRSAPLPGPAAGGSGRSQQ